MSRAVLDAPRIVENVRTAIEGHNGYISIPKLAVAEEIDRTVIRAPFVLMTSFFFFWVQEDNS